MKEVQFNLSQHLEEIAQFTGISEISKAAVTGLLYKEFGLKEGDYMLSYVDQDGDQIIAEVEEDFAIADLTTEKNIKFIVGVREDYNFACKKVKLEISQSLKIKENKLQELQIEQLNNSNQLVKICNEDHNIDQIYALQVGAELKQQNEGKNQQPILEVHAKKQKLVKVKKENKKIDRNQVLQIVRNEIKRLMPMIKQEVRKEFNQKEKIQQKSGHQCILCKENSFPFFINPRTMQTYCTLCEQDLKIPDLLVKIRSAHDAENIVRLNLIPVYAYEIRTDANQQVTFLTECREMAIKKLKENYLNEIQISKQEVKRLANEKKEEQKRKNKQKRALENKNAKKDEKKQDKVKKDRTQEKNEVKDLKREQKIVIENEFSHNQL